MRAAPIEKRRIVQADCVEGKSFSRSQARVTIGMPIYNAAEFIEQTLAGLRDQTFHNYILHVSDDASTDGTWDLLQQWARRDSRIVLHRQASNIGMMRNFRYVLDRAETEYFMWHAYDDWAAPNYLEQLLAVMGTEPHCALACGTIVCVREDSVSSEQHLFPELGMASRSGRIRRMFHGMRPEWLYGLFRTLDLRRAHLMAEEFGYVWAADHLTLLQFILNDRVRGSNKTVFYYRKGQRSTQKYRPNKLVRQMPYLARYAWYNAKVFRASGLTLGEKLACLPWLANHALSPLGNARQLIKAQWKRVKRCFLCRP